MEKFALLNLLKAIDGLKSAQQTETAAASATPRADPNAAAKQTDSVQAFKTPNFMYEAILRHEQVSNKLKNKRNA